VSSWTARWGSPARAERSVRVGFTGFAAALARERWPEAASGRPDGIVAVETLQVPGNFLHGWVLGYGGLDEVEALRALYAR
jgi:hypothetical protein